MPLFPNLPSRLGGGLFPAVDPMQQRQALNLSLLQTGLGLLGQSGQPQPDIFGTLSGGLDLFQGLLGQQEELGRRRSAEDRAGRAMELQEEASARAAEAEKRAAEAFEQDKKMRPLVEANAKIESVRNAVQLQGELLMQQGIENMQRSLQEVIAKRGPDDPLVIAANAAMVSRDPVQIGSVLIRMEQRDALEIVGPQIANALHAYSVSPTVENAELLERLARESKEQFDFDRLLAIGNSMRSLRRLDESAIERNQPDLNTLASETRQVINSFMSSMDKRRQELSDPISRMGLVQSGLRESADLTQEEIAFLKATDTVEKQYAVARELGFEAVGDSIVRRLGPEEAQKFRGMFGIGDLTDEAALVAKEAKSANMDREAAREQLRASKRYSEAQIEAALLAAYGAG